MHRKDKLKGILFISILAILLVQLGCHQENSKAPEYYKVVEVIDGDTYRLNNGEKIRLIGINTPELNHPNQSAEYYGMEAYKYIKPRVLNQEVKLKFDVTKRDKYHRLLVYLYLKDGTFVNEILVEQGYARVMTVPPNVSKARTFLALESLARTQKLGLWGQRSPGAINKSQNVPIKGNINNNGEKIYHVPGGKYYKQTKAEEYFSTEVEARRAGYRRAKQ